MKKILAALGWLAFFAAAGICIMLGLAAGLLPHQELLAKTSILTGTGVLPGLFVWLLTFCFAGLPGARRSPGTLPYLGLVQGLWGIAGTLLMMLCGGLLPGMLALYLQMPHMLRHQQVHLPGAHDTTLIITSLLASELLAALWLIWYIRRQGPEILTDGTPTGIAWRPAPLPAYGMAALGALAIILLAGLEFRVFPPDLSKLTDLDLAKLIQGPPIVALLAALVITILAPFIEELLFRGLAFAGIARRLGPTWATIITTLIFTALHAPEKLLYPPGFIDVAAIALLSCALRLHYHSIRPGIAMHFLYNAGMLIVPAIAGAR